MTPTMHPRERAARLALLSGEPIEMIRFLVVTIDGEVRFAAFTAPEHVGRPFMVDIAQMAERQFPDLERYADEDRVLFSIPITVRQTSDGGWYWESSVDVVGSIVASCGARPMQIAHEIATEILPIVVAAADAGAFP